MITVEFKLGWEYFGDTPDSIERHYMFSLKRNELVLIGYEEIDLKYPDYVSQVIKRFHEGCINVKEGDLINTIKKEEIPFPEIVPVVAKNILIDSIKVVKDQTNL